MVVLNKIYTKTGDDGTTALGDGARRTKYDLRIESYGSVDETNACIGLARIYSKNESMDAVLELVQNDLFDLGADLAVPPNQTENKWIDENKVEALRITDGQVLALEAHIDQYNNKLQPLRSFVLSGGSELAAHLHMARTICRRAERVIIALQQSDGEIVNSGVVKYVNRLSDLLFVLARYANDHGKSDVLWVPGKNR